MFEIWWTGLKSRGPGERTEREAADLMLGSSIVTRMGSRTEH